MVLSNMSNRTEVTPTGRNDCNERDTQSTVDSASLKSSRKVSRLTVVEKALDLDDVLVHELGQFGWFQLRNIALVAIPLMVSAFMTEYIFSSAALLHRCKIPECGEVNDRDYNQEWISNAIPASGSGLVSCERFVPLATNGSLDYCPPELFDNLYTETCPHGYVYGKHNTVVYEFDLGCNEWLRALAGTISSIGAFFSLPIIGFISDKFGRRTALVFSAFSMSLFGLIRAFSINYPMYLVLQFLQTTFGGGIFSSAYIFAAELVGPKYRVLTSVICSSLFATGQIIMGSVAWAVQPWRYMTLALNIPCFIIVTYYWFLNESVRWLLSKSRYEEAKTVLEEVARVNGTQISEKSMQALLNPPAQSVDLQKNRKLWSTIARSPVLIRRVCTTPIWWVTTILVYYGLSINSASLSDTTYLNYILTCAIEIPGYFLAVLVLDRIGRRWTLFGGFFLSAVCNISFIFIPSRLSVLRLVAYLMGKFGISVVFTSLYLFTSELYPTEFRHNLLGFSSMIGRIGSITAPLTPALMTYWEGIPSMMFGVLGLISGVLVLTQPETLGTKLPDTLAEAEALGSSVHHIKKDNL